MKLIIDIPEEDYNDIITCNPEVETEYVLDLLMKCVDNGTPFEQIRDEIKHLLNRPSLTHVVGYDKGFVDAIDKVLRVIDKYREEQTE